ncbi:3906_t:CDS:2 [Funneliformis geosporum]|uniref:3906_t:CDS:1 n=1 Tax=Funneliformis geosporum TaxID=1117311 RepID=A0A9W4SHV2_9GLOM|nr:3906_t:CDS:2 [Funneliformis geosporum]
MLYDINELANYILDIIAFYYLFMYNNLSNLCFLDQVERGRAKGLGGKIEEGEGGKLGRVEEIEEEAFEGPGIGEEEGEGVGVNLGGESVEKSLKRDYLRKGEGTAVEEEGIKKGTFVEGIEEGTKGGIEVETKRRLGATIARLTP